MTTPREFDRSKLHKGKGICRWCGSQVPKGRRSWCSQTCVNAYLDASDWSRMRRKCFERDRYRCQICGRNIEATERWVRGVKRFLRYEAARKFERLAGLDVRMSLADADHIVALAEGGPHTIDNLRTLCVWCHKAETKALAARRAKARRKQTELPLGG
jgi:5-methylcytosine-specific restriction enzyme A